MIMFIGGSSTAALSDELTGVFTFVVVNSVKTKNTPLPNVDATGPFPPAPHSKRRTFVCVHTRFKANSEVEDVMLPQICDFS